MDSPHLDAFGDRELLASGPSGAVFRAVKSDGSVSAVKLLDGMSINRSLLETACRRLERGGWPKGVLRVLEADFRARPAARVTPCLADQTADGHWRPRSLQHRLDEFPGESSWDVVLGIIDALASLHDRQVAHANLKPGNVFFDDDGSVVLVDWCLGNVPGVGNHEFTDACLYQPPEQLRSADGYNEEEGYRWDVYALGVLAYRLLTGAFPRCDETFQQVAPLNGQITREDIAADYPKIASTLEKQGEVKWPGEPANDLEKRYREVLDRCLALEPMARPANALEVRRLIRSEEIAIEEAEKRDAVLNQRRKAQRAAWRSGIAACLLLGGLAFAVFQWQTVKARYEDEVTGREKDVTGLKGELDTARSERTTALELQKKAENTLKAETTTWLARIQESRQLGDRLFAWAMVEGHRKLPPLDGRELRLNRLEEYFEGFLERTAHVPEFGDERAMARLQLAEISLAKGDADTATKRFSDAIKYTDELQGSPALTLRLATDKLILALLLQERNDPKTSQALTEARDALLSVPKAGVDADRMTFLLATLDLRESEYMAIQGREGRALELLQQATESLNALADHRPEAGILRSELISCYLSSASILDGMGELGDARGLRSLAADKLLEMIKKDPANLDLRLKLAGCYGAIAENAVIAGDVAQAESMSKGAVKLLTEVIPQRPDSVIARSRLAAQKGLMAGILRDRGDGDEALKLYDEGLRQIEGLTVGDAADPMARYRYALLTWEKGRMLGFSGKRTQEIEHHEKAVNMLDELLDTQYGVVHGEQIRRSMAYLLGDLGHAAQLQGMTDLSSSSFTRAVREWELLNRDRPGSEEYEEALAWNRQRLDSVR